METKHELSIETLSYCIYIVNKTAKKIRDSKVLYYDMKHHRKVEKLKEKECRLYDLKTRAIEKAHKKGIASITGFNTQDYKLSIKNFKYICRYHKSETCKCYDGNHDLIEEERFEYCKQYFLLYKIGEASFHIPCEENETAGFDWLGELADYINEESQTIHTGYLNLKDAISILERFIAR